MTALLESGPSMGPERAWVALHVTGLEAAFSHVGEARALERLRRLAARLATEAGPGARFDGGAGVVGFESVERAVERALAWRASEEGRSLSYAITWAAASEAGPVVLGAELGAARRVAALGVGEVEVLPAAQARWTPGEGLGCFRAPAHREALLGHPVFTVRDYR